MKRILYMPALCVAMVCAAPISAQTLEDLFPDVQAPTAPSEQEGASAEGLVTPSDALAEVFPPELETAPSSDQNRLSPPGPRVPRSSDAFREDLFVLSVDEETVDADDVREAFRWANYLAFELTKSREAMEMLAAQQAGPDPKFTPYRD